MGLQEPDDVWKQYANCKNYPDPHIFYSEWPYEQEQAKSICQVCSVKDECLQYALSHKKVFGIWGGETERSRRRIIRLRRATLRNS